MARATSQKPSARGTSYTSVTASMTLAHAQWITNQAIKQDRSVSFVMRAILDEYFKLKDIDIFKEE